MSATPSNGTRSTIDGDIAAKDCEVTYLNNGRKFAVVTIGRDRQSLIAEAGLEALIAEA